MSQQLKLAIIGDPHVAKPHGEPDERLEVDPGRKLHGLSVELLSATVAAVNAEADVDAAIVLGDITRDSELFNHEVARGLLKQLRMPYYIVVGNHDLRRQRPEGASYPDAQRLDRDEVGEFYRDQGLPGGMTRYVVELPGDVVLVVADSNRSLAELSAAGEELKRQDDGWLGEDQLGWLDGVLKQITAGGRLPLVAVHHTLMDHSPAEQPGHLLYRVFRYWQLHDAKALRECLNRHRVPLVLSGHLHAQSVGEENGVMNLATAASVSYPHAWRLLTFEAGVVHVQSRLIEAIPSVPSLQEKSRQWMAEGMGQLVEEKVAAVPMLAGLTRELREFVIGSGWWDRFCDGTLAGFSVEPPKGGGNAIHGMVFGQVAQLLSQYGAWKAARPDPNELTIPLAAR